MSYDVCNGVGNGSTTLQLTVGSGSAGSPQGTTANDVIFVCGGSSSSQNITNVTDTKSNAYTAQVSDSGGGNQGAIWTSPGTTALVAGTDKITVTFSGSTGKQGVIVKAASGVSSATADQTAHASASSTSPDAGPTGPLNQANELVMSMIGNASTGGTPSGLSWGGAGTTVRSGSSGPYFTVFTESVSATAPVDASGTLTATANWCALTATFKLTSTGALTVTSTSPPAGTVGSAYNAGAGYTLTATGGSGAGYTWSVKTGPLPPGLALAAGSAGGHVCGNSVKTSGSTAHEVSIYNTWQGPVASGGLGLYQVAARKIYFNSPNGPSQSGSFPVNATAALWEANNSDVGAALTNGYGMHLCFRPVATGTYNDPGWPSAGGILFPQPGNSSTPGTILGDYALMKATIQSIQSACASVANGASVLSVILWQENDNKSGFPSQYSTTGVAGNSFAASHNYFAYYPLLKADFPHLPVYASYVNYPHGTPAQDAEDRSQRFPGPSPLNPGGWGTATVNGNSVNLFCDGITTDEYADGAYGLASDGVTVVTNPTGRLRYIFAEPDLYTPASGGTPASGHPGWGDVALYNSIPWGNLETGNNASTGNPAVSQMNAYLAGMPTNSPVPVRQPDGTSLDTMVHSILADYQTLVSLNAPFIGMCWYENADNPPPPAGTGQNNITSSSDPRIPWLNAIDSATAQSTSSIINGTPASDSSVTYPHAYPVTVKVKDSSGTAATAALSFTVNTGTVTLAVTTTSLVSGTAGQAYSQQLANNGGGTGTGYTWTLNSGSLTGSGVTLSSGGLLSGAGPVAGSYGPLVFRVTDSGSNTALSGSLTLTVNAAGVAVTISSTSPLASGTTGDPYLQFLTASGGTPPYTFTLATASSLPPGLVLDNTDPADDESGAAITDEFGADITSEA